MFLAPNLVQFLPHFLELVLSLEEVLINRAEHVSVLLQGLVLLAKGDYLFLEHLERILIFLLQLDVLLDLRILFSHLAPATLQLSLRFPQHFVLVLLFQKGYLISLRLQIRLHFLQLALQLLVFRLQLRNLLAVILLHSLQTFLVLDFPRS